MAIPALNRRPAYFTGTNGGVATGVVSAIALFGFSLWALGNSSPRWLCMWLLIGTVYFGFKSLSLAVDPMPSASAPRWLAYLSAWPGMNAAEFLSVDRIHENVPKRREWLEGVFNVVAGAAIFWTAHRWLSPEHPLALGWVGMVGTVLMLHFGAFHLLSCAWRGLGVNARPLMELPTRSTSVGQFWGRRWNTAFRDVAHRFVFRPLAGRVGATSAVIVVFVFSGVVHEIAISIPAGDGYGGPTAYFCIQAAALLLERSQLGRAIGLGHGLRGWLFTAAVLLLPVRLLFHDPFLIHVVVPFMEAMNAA